jgi:hypothetical protein
MRRSLSLLHGRLLLGGGLRYDEFRFDVQSGESGQAASGGRKMAERGNLAFVPSRHLP